MDRTLGLRPLGRTGLQVTEIGLGTVPLGGLFAPVSEPAAREVLNAAWAAGIRYVDTAPMYGIGRSERLTGDLLRERAGGVLSTKVGRLLVAPRAGLDLAPPPPRNPLDPGWHNGLNFQEKFDYSHDGVMRSFEDSRQRLGMTAIDILLIHDIGRLTHGPLHDHHWAALTKGGGFRALEELRANGDIRGFGLGVNETQAIHDAMDEADLDVCLLAGRYSLIDRQATSLMAKMQRHGVALVLGGVFNSGILAAPKGTKATFDYAAAPPAIVALVDQVRRICDAHDVPLGAAALQFGLRHPAVSSVVLGVRSLAELDQNLGWHRHHIPDALWPEIDTVIGSGES